MPNNEYNWTQSEAVPMYNCSVQAISKIEEAIAQMKICSHCSAMNNCEMNVTVITINTVTLCSNF